jgi:hypothetical protein
VPLSGRSAFGAPGPRRTPRPAAGMTAAVRVGRARLSVPLGFADCPDADIELAFRFASSTEMGMATACRARCLDQPLP